jgi:hypothetical protein
MAFLDNSGDIILDVVLTDEGRKRLAQGDGSFKVDKFALGDDEVNYALYNATASSGQEDLQILQTPVLEAFTNNMSSMKSTLLSYPRNDLFHLPVLKLNEVFDTINQRFASPSIFMVAADSNTEDNSDTQNPSTSVALGSTGTLQSGFLLGANPSNGGTVIRIDSGIDNSAAPPSTQISDPTLYETSYEIKIDNRLGSIVSKTGGIIQPVAIDDDFVASYIVGGPGQRITGFVSENTDTSAGAARQVIAGSRSTFLEFKIATSQSLRSSTHLFNLIGSAGSMTSPNGAQSILFIDSIVRVTGQLTGYSVDLPVRFVKNN